MNYIISIIFIIVFILFGTNIGYSTTSPAWTRFTYMFQHSGVIHLACNTFVFISFFKILVKIFPIIKLIVYTYLAGILASIGTAYPVVTVGASGMIYGMIGLYMSAIFISKKLTIIDKKKFITWFCIIIIATMATLFQKNINGVNHVHGLISGILIGIIDYSVEWTRGKS